MFLWVCVIGLWLYTTVIWLCGALTVFGITYIRPRAAAHGHEEAHLESVRVDASTVTTPGSARTSAGVQHRASPGRGTRNGSFTPPAQLPYMTSPAHGAAGTLHKPYQHAPPPQMLAVPYETRAPPTQNANSYTLSDGRAPGWKPHVQLKALDAAPRGTIEP